MIDLAKVQALCFDVDGTLRDTDDQYVSKFARYFKLIRWMLPNRDAQAAARKLVMWAEAPGNFVYSVPDRIGLDDEMFALQNWLINKGFRTPKKHDYLAMAGIQDMLAALQPHYKLAIISARNQRGTLGFLDHYNLTPYFEVIASALSAPRSKPFPDPVLWTAQQLGVPPTACLMIGDTTYDIKAGKRAGAQTVGVLCGFGEQDELKKAGADLILPNTTDLPGILFDKDAMS